MPVAHNSFAAFVEESTIGELSSPESPAQHQNANSPRAVLPAPLVTDGLKDGWDTDSESSGRNSSKNDDEKAAAFSAFPSSSPSG